MELSASFFYIYNPFSSVTDKRKNRHLLFSPFFPLFRVLFFTLRKKKKQTDFPSLFRMVGEGGGTRRCAHPAPASAFRERKAERGGGGRGGDGTGRSGGVAALSLPAVGLRPRCESALPGASPDGAPAPLRSAPRTQALPLSPPLQKSHVPPLPQRGEEAESAKFLLLTLLSLACIAGVLAASGVVYCLRHRAHHRLKEKLSALGADAGSDATAAYQVSTSLPPPPSPPPPQPRSAPFVFSASPLPSPLNVPGNGSLLPGRRRGSCCKFVSN